jgi:hypothetical protein
VAGGWRVVIAASGTGLVDRARDVLAERGISARAAHEGRHRVRGDAHDPGRGIRDLGGGTRVRRLSQVRLRSAAVAGADTPVDLGAGDFLTLPELQAATAERGGVWWTPASWRARRRVRGRRGMPRRREAGSPRAGRRRRRPPAGAIPVTAVTLLPSRELLLTPPVRARAAALQDRFPGLRTMLWSTSSPKNSTRYGWSATGGKTSRMPPRTANSPRRETMSTRW